MSSEKDHLEDQECVLEHKKKGRLNQFSAFCKTIVPPYSVLLNSIQHLTSYFFLLTDDGLQM